MRIYQLSVLCFLLLTLSACMNDAGIKLAHMQNKSQMMLTSEAYGNLKVKEDNVGSYKEFLGEYQVQQSWDNNVFHIDRVVIKEQDNKLVILTYPKGWQNPNQKTEFTGCYVANTVGDSKYFINNTGKKLSCGNPTTNSFKGHSMFEVAKTTNNTIAKSPIPEFYLGTMLPPRNIKIDTPYAMQLDLWDQAKPILAVTKSN